MGVVYPFAGASKGLQNPSLILDHLGYHGVGAVPLQEVYGKLARYTRL